MPEIRTSLSWHERYVLLLLVGYAYSIFSGALGLLQWGVTSQASNYIALTHQLDTVYSNGDSVRDSSYEIFLLTLINCICTRELDLTVCVGQIRHQIPNWANVLTWGQSLTLFQSLANSAGYDPTRGPGSSCTAPNASGQCVLPWGRGTKAVSSIVLVANGASFAVMTIIFTTIGSAADYGTLARWVLLFMTVVCWIAQFASMTLTCEHFHLISPATNLVNDELWFCSSSSMGSRDGSIYDWFHQLWRDLGFL